MSTSQDFNAQIINGVITAHLAATFAGLLVYVHTIEHADGVVLVDTGMIDSTPELDEEGAPVPMPENIPREVACVINTHLHFDHCGGNRLFPGVAIHVQRLALEGPYDPPEWVDFPRAEAVKVARPVARPPEPPPTEQLPRVSRFRPWCLRPAADVLGSVGD